MVPAWTLASRSKHVLTCRLRRICRFDEVGVNDMEDLAQLWGEIELLRAAEAETQAQDYTEQADGVFQARHAAAVPDQTQLLEASLPMKNLAPGHALGGGPAAGGGQRQQSATTTSALKTVRELHDAARRVLSRGFAPGSSGAAHTKCCEEALALVRLLCSPPSAAALSVQPSWCVARCSAI